MLVSTGFFPSTFTTNVPGVRVFNQAASPTFLKGYPVVVTTGLLDECGAAPALIAGVALQDNSTNPGYSAANSPTPITGQSTTASVALAIDSTEFGGFLVNGSATIIAPVAADIGSKYGLSKQTGGWRVDKSLTAGNARVIVTRIDTTNNVVFFRVLAANQQFSA